VVTKAGLTVLS